MAFRDSIRRIRTPTFLGVVGEKIDFTVHLVLDGLTVNVEYGVKARMPDLAPEDALPLIGRDRRIVRGFVESSASYRARLRRWLDDWRYAGNAYSIMQQIRGYVSPYTPRMRIVDNSANWYTLETDGSKTWSRPGASNWNWDGGTDWSRFWVIIYSTSGPWTRAKWGAPRRWGVPQQTWGSSAQLDEVKSIRSIVRDWKPAHSTCKNIIVCFDASKFDPTAAPGAPMPDGTWGPWGKMSGGFAVATREPKAIYWDGVSN